MSAQKKTRTPLTGLWCLWRYDDPPFLCDRAIEMLDDGSVTVEGYQGMQFKPITLVPEARGVEIKKRLGELRAAKHADLLAVREKYAKLYADLLPSGVKL